MSLLIFTRLVRSLGCDLAAGLLLQAPLIFGSQHLAGHLRGRVHDQPTEFALQLAHGALVLESACFARLGDDLLGGHDRFLLFAFGDDAGAGPCLIDHFLRFAIAFSQDFLVALLSFGELLFDLLGIEKAFGDSLPPLFEHTVLTTDSGPEILTIPRAS